MALVHIKFVVYSLASVVLWRRLSDRQRLVGSIDCCCHQACDWLERAAGCYGHLRHHAAMPAITAIMVQCPKASIDLASIVVCDDSHSHSPY